MSQRQRSYFQRYADFSGRSTRSAFWFFQLANLFIVLLLWILTSIIGTDLLYNLWILGTIVPGFALNFRRLHDMGKSAWNLLWCIIPGFVFGVSLVMLILSILSKGMSLKNPDAVTNALTQFDVGLALSVFVSFIVTIVGCIILLVYAIVDSQRGTNKWGPSEKYPDAE